jgi:WhiB family redox-sensing transcriptional regulator
VTGRKASFDPYEATPVELGSWRDRAACVGTPSEMWFPTIGGRGDRPATIAAKQLCALCDVRHECLEGALSMSEWADHGIRGGLNEHQRRLIRRARRNSTRKAN